MLLGENWCWQLLGPKGLSLHYSTVKKKLKTPSVVVTNTEDKEMYPVFRRHNLRELAYCISLVYQYVFPRLSGWIPLGWPKSGSIIWDHLDKPINLFPKAKEFIGYYVLWSKWSQITHPDPDHYRRTHSPSLYFKASSDIFFKGCQNTSTNFFLCENRDTWCLESW